MAFSRRTFIGGALSGIGAALLDKTPGLARKRRRKRDDGPRPLFKDTFDRPDQRGWGRAWFNQRYRRRWVIRDRRGIYRLPASETNAYYRPNPILVLNRDVANLDLRATLSASNRTARFGVLVRATGYADYYACYLGPGNVLRVTRCEAHNEKVIGRYSLPVEENRRYRIRFQARGGGPVNLRAKAWPVGAREPRRWLVDKTDATERAIVSAGAFGAFVEHATDGRSATIRYAEVVAWSNDEPRSTTPAIAYALAGPVDRQRVKVVAKTAVPAHVAFEYAPEPTFTRGLQVVEAGKTTRRAQTATAKLDLSAYGPSSVVYWRAISQRGTQRVVSATFTFRTSPGRGLPARFAFGACTRWKVSPRTSFEQARLKLPDFYLHQGDLGYVPHRVIDHAMDTYQDHWTRMLMDPHLAGMCREVPLAFYRDDADYGINLADSQTLRRFTIQAHGQLHANPSNDYFTFRYGDLAVFCIDCRRFSSGKIKPANERSKLGDQQKAWLKHAMKDAAADPAVGLLVVASPQAFGSDRSPESWRRAYASEWAELIDFFKNLEAPVLIVSGDAHGHRLHEYPQKNMDPGVPRIVEFVSAGTEQNKFESFVEPQFLLQQAKGSGFGLVELGTEQDVAGERTRTLSLSAFRSKDGSPFWTQDYVIVRGVGIFPVG